MNNSSARFPRQPVRPTWTRERLILERELALQAASDDYAETHRHELGETRHSTHTFRAPTLTVDLIISCLESFPHPTHDESLFLTLLCVGFHALLRLGELVWPDNDDHRDYRKVSLRHTVEFLPSAIAFTLPYRKADHSFEGSRILVQQLHPELDPLPLLRDYLQSRDRLFPLRLELWLTEAGSIPTRSWFLDRFHEHFADLPSGRSLREGGATMLASLGVPLHVIQAMGRWSSNTWQIYIQEHPAILTTAAAFLGSK
jgi:hypothetical protein